LPGTERGVFISWNGGQDWSPFQLNLPVTPITDLRIHRGNSDRGHVGPVVLDSRRPHPDRQYKTDAPAFSLFKPANAYLVNGGSDLDDPDEEFTGANAFRGVNPATGVVLYYQLPEMPKTDAAAKPPVEAPEVTLEITDADGKLVRTFTSKKNPDFKKWDGGPPRRPVLPASKGT
jgi:hypothetical protein